MPRLLLLANDFAFARLRRHAGLPAMSLVDWTDEPDLAATAGEDGNGTDDSPDDPRILRLRPNDLFPPSQPSRERLEQTDYQLAFLLKSVVCQLVVIGDDADEGQVSITSIGDWYDRFAKLVAARIPEHREHYAHALVMVFASPPPDKAQAAEILGRLTSGARPDVDAVYIMQPDLELGDKQYFHARHVWPAAAGGLLLRLASHPPEANGERLLAWRAMRVQPAFGAQTVDTAIAAAGREAARRLRERLSSAERPDRLSSLTMAATEIEDPQQPEVPTVGAPASWQEFQAAMVTDHVLSTQRWAEPLADLGVEFRRARSSRALTALASLRNAVAHRWADVHESPAHLFEQRRRRADSRPDLANRLAEVEQATRNLGDLDKTLRELDRRLREDSADLDEARAFFLDLGLRLLCAVIVAAAAFWAAHSLYWYFGLARAWTYLSVAALAGATLPVVSMWALERWRGGKAIADLRKRYDKADDLVWDRFAAGWDLLDTAGQAGIDLRAFAAWQRMQRLLDRTEAILDWAMHPTAEAEPGAGAGDQPLTGEATPPSEGDADREANRVSELSQFARLTVRSFDVSARLLDDETAMDQLVAVEARKFTNDLWRPLCDQYDPRTRGLLPIRAFLPRLSAFFFQFQLNVEAALMRRVLAAGLGDRDPVERAAQFIADFAKHPNWFGMSCAVPGRGPERIRRLIFVGPDLKDRMHDPLGGEFQNLLVDSPLLHGRALLAVLFEETPVSVSEAMGSDPPAEEETAPDKPNPSRSPR